MTWANFSFLLDYNLFENPSWQEGNLELIKKPGWSVLDNGNSAIKSRFSSTNLRNFVSTSVCLDFYLSPVRSFGDFTLHMKIPLKPVSEYAADSF